MAVLVEYDDDIRLKHIRLGQIDIEWSMVKYSEWVICQIAQKNEFEITGNILMKPARRWCHVKVSVNKLIPRSGLRKISIVLHRQSGGIRSDNHPRKSIRYKSRTQLRLGTEATCGKPKGRTGLCACSVNAWPTRRTLINS